MSFVREARGHARLGAVPYRDPLMRRAARSHWGLGATTAQQAGASAAAVGTTIAAIGAATATGATIGSVVPILGTAIGAIVGAGVALFASAPTVDNLKNVWDVVPFSLIRLTGGHGTWTDPLTHAVLTDAGSDVRKSAVVASALGCFNDQNNFWYDDTTQQHLTPNDTWQRWLQKFGNVTFAAAYAAAPSAFLIFSPTNVLGDPPIHAPTAVTIAPSTLQTAIIGVTPVSTTAPVTPATASLIGGVSNTTLALVAAGILAAMLVSRSRRTA